MFVENLESEAAFFDFQSNKAISYSNEMTMEYVGVADAKTPKRADGFLLLSAIFDDGTTLVTDQYQAIGGPHGNGSPENGEYNVDNIQPNRDDKSGMVRQGVSFSLNMNPLFDTGRTDLRIHPDGGDFVGTSGCIGLQEGPTELRSFRHIVRMYLSNHENIRLTVNIQGNPNNDGKGAAVKSNGE